MEYERNLMTIEEFCKYVVHIGRKVFIHKELFDEELKKSAKFQLTL